MALLAGNPTVTLGGNPWNNPEMFNGIDVPAGAEHRPGRFHISAHRRERRRAAATASA